MEWRLCHWVTHYCLLTFWQKELGLSEVRELTIIIKLWPAAIKNCNTDTGYTIYYISKYNTYNIWYIYYELMTIIRAISMTIDNEDENEESNANDVCGFLNCWTPVFSCDPHRWCNAWKVERWEKVDICWNTWLWAPIGRKSKRNHTCIIWRRCVIRICWKVATQDFYYHEDFRNMSKLFLSSIRNVIISC